MIGLNFQVIGFQLNRDMAVAQVVSRADQVKRGTVVGSVLNKQDFLCTGYHFYKRTIFRHQYIPAAYQCAPGQEHTQLSASGISGIKSTFLPDIPI